jgi:hypothetical protein
MRLVASKAELLSEIGETRKTDYLKLVTADEWHHFLVIRSTSSKINAIVHA